MHQTVVLPHRPGTYRELLRPAIMAIRLRLPYCDPGAIRLRPFAVFQAAISPTSCPARPTLLHFRQRHRNSPAETKAQQPRGQQLGTTGDPSQRIQS